MDLLMRRRALMGKDNYIDPFPDYVRIVVKGNGDSAVTLSYYNARPYIIDNKITVSNSDSYVFNDYLYHDVYFYIAKFSQNRFSGDARIVDIPENITTFGGYNQTFAVNNGSKIRHFIIRSKTFIGVPENASSPYFLWGSGKHVKLYVPNDLVNDYTNTKNKNNITYNTMTIVPLETSIFKARQPLNKIVKELNLT